MTYFIIATRKSGSSESEITAYRYYTTSPYFTTDASKEEFHSITSEYLDTFYSHNIEQGTKVNCEWYHDADVPYLKSDPNGTHKDNLLELPPF